MIELKGSSGKSGTSGCGSFAGVTGVTPCCGSKSKIGPIVDGDITFYCEVCENKISRNDFITIEEYINFERLKKLNDILDDK